MAIYSTSKSPATAAAAAGAVDWAAHADAVPVAADWVSTSTLGGATGVYKTERSLGLRMSTDRRVDGTSIDGVRVQGLAHVVPEGDIVLGLRLSIDRVDTQASATPAGAYEAGVVFVDGGNVGTAAFYGFMQYWSSTNYASRDTYRITDEGGGARFESRSYILLLGAPGIGSGPYDVFFVRVGTTLTVYAGPVGGVPQVIYSWTVTDGAGLLALRAQIHSAGMPDIQPVIHAYRTFTEVPW